MSNLNLTTVEGVRLLMAGSKSEREWNDNCDKVKDANGGYPDFWFATVVISGLAARTQSSW